MKKNIIITVGLYFMVVSAVLSQVVVNERLVKANLRKHILKLASDSMYGRETSTRGEQLASDYLVNEFTSIGLQPMGDPGKFTNGFLFTDGVHYGRNNEVILKTVSENGNRIAERKILIDSMYYPLMYSATAKAEAPSVFVGYGISAPSLSYNDYAGLKDLKGKVFVMESSTPDGKGPHSKYSDYADLRQKIDTAIQKGAVAVVFMNSDTSSNNPAKQSQQIKISPSSVPVIFISDKSLYPMLKNGITYSIQTEVTRTEKAGKNVIGFIDNKSERTVIIGAHYDHLGYGEEGSLYRGTPEIHNGADDNASGTAALLEIARFLKDPTNLGFQKNNYLIMAFSGEEKGLFGSASFVKNPTYPLEKINYTINMDMVGRLNAEKKLAVNGTGTSPEWVPVLNAIHIDSITMNYSESGIGPSDQTSFYLKNMPVLHFFTGSHSDYHKPTDDEKKINYAGEVSVIRIILSTIQSLDSKGKIPFTKTKEEKSDDVPRFKVTLGVVPDYMFDGEGMRIEGINDGKPAFKAGLEAGDIVIAIGENSVVDMMSYMKALSKFKKGDITTVKIKRGKDILEKQIQF